MFPHRDLARGGGDYQEVHVNSAADGVGWTAVRKKAGATMVQFIVISGGGGGGAGAVGLVSAAAGGGSGSNSTVTVVTIPTALLPDTFYVSVGVGGAGGAVAAAGGDGINSYVSVQPSSGSSFVIANATHGWGAGTASAGTGGTAGPAAVAPSATSMRLGWQFASIMVNGQVGLAGGNTGTGNGITQANTGIFLTPGASGAGLNGSGVAGSTGGGFTGFATGFIVPALGGAGGSAATTPPENGGHGYRASQFGHWLGGCGGGSSHGSATGAGLFGGNGGNGAYGCGGGGGGGALTGSTQSVGGRGGDGLVMITHW